MRGPGVSGRSGGTPFHVPSPLRSSRPWCRTPGSITPFFRGGNWFRETHRTERVPKSRRTASPLPPGLGERLHAADGPPAPAGSVPI